MFGRSVKTSRSMTRGKRHKAVESTCPRCRQLVRASAPRCPGCGNRLFFKSEATPIKIELPEQTVTSEPVPQYDLSEIQRRILTAAREGGSIFVYRLPGPDEGEVKSGNERFFGDEAVTALATLVAPGLIAETGEDRFELTAAGQKLVESLD
jgi:hypothetical protein